MNECEGMLIMRNIVCKNKIVNEKCEVSVMLLCFVAKTWMSWIW